MSAVPANAAVDSLSRQKEMLFEPSVRHEKQSNMRFR